MTHTNIDKIDRFFVYNEVAEGHKIPLTFAFPCRGCLARMSISIATCLSLISCPTMPLVNIINICNASAALADTVTGAQKHRKIGRFNNTAHTELLHIHSKITHLLFGDQDVVDYRSDKLIHGLVLHPTGERSTVPHSLIVNVLNHSVDFVP